MVVDEAQWDETEDLRVASTGDTAVLELDLDGTVRYVSPSWDQFMTLIRDPSDLVGKNIASIVAGSADDKDVFASAMRDMEEMSVTVRFAVETTQPGKDDLALQLEAQGVLVNYALEKYAVWVVSPYVPRPPVSVQLPAQLIRTTGFATQVFADFLESLAAAVRSRALEVPAPPQELCRICERFVKTWWFERHHWLCTLEHKAEQRVLKAQEQLLDQREAIRWALANKRLPSPRGSPIPLATTIPRVSSPLAPNHSHSNSPVLSVHGQASSSSPGSPTSASPGLCYDPREVDILSRLLERCDVALSLEVPDAAEDEPISPETAETLCEIRSWKDIETDALTERTLLTETTKKIDYLASAVELMGSIVRYSATLWHEVESQVRSTIEATVAAAESNAESVTIDPESKPGEESYSSGDDTEPDLDHEEVIPDDFDLNKQQKRQLHRLNSASSISPFPPNSPRISPKLSPRLHPHHPISPRLSPRVWPASPLTPSMPSPTLYSLSNAGPLSLSPSNMLSSSPHQHQQPTPMLVPGTPPGRRNFTSVSAARAHGLSLSSFQRRLSTATTASASSSDDLPAIGRPTQPTIRDYEVLKPISRGAYGVVYLAKKKLTGELFAIKVLSKSQMVLKNQVQHVRAERQILISTASSPHVATLFYTFQSRDYLYLVMEFLPGGDCAALLKQLGCLPESWAQRYVAEIIVAVDSLHTQGALHRDLKPDNLLIDARGHLKLSDFGLSTAATSARADPDSVAGTPDYLAPETIMGEPQSEGTDWWALGCIAYELLYGVPPFNDASPSGIMDNIVNRKLSFPELPPEEDVSATARNFISSLLRLDPSSRPSSEAIRKHPWLKSIDWSKLDIQDGPFVPKTTNPTSTDYFDDRGALSLPPQDWENPDIEFLGGTGRRSRRSSSQSSNSLGPVSGGLAPLSGINSLSGGLGVASGTSASTSGSGSNTTPIEANDAAFGSFSYRNLPLLERANADVITKLRSEPRRPSISSPVSATTTLSEDDTTYRNETDLRNAALERVRKRQQLRRSFCGPQPSALSHQQYPSDALDILVCSDQTEWLAAAEKTLKSLSCHVVTVDTSEEAIRRLTSGVQFDLVILSMEESIMDSAAAPTDSSSQHTFSSSPSTPASGNSSTPRGYVTEAEVSKIVRGTLNSNVDTPILASRNWPGVTGIIPAPLPTDEVNLGALLHKYCGYEMTPQVGSTHRATSLPSLHLPGDSPDRDLSSEQVIAD